MGKKSFVENYDPLKAHLVRDHERAESTLRMQNARPAPPLHPPSIAAREDRSGAQERPASAPTQRHHPQASEPAQLPPRRRSGAADDLHEVSARVKVPRSAFQDLETVLAQIQFATGSKIHYSIATRALWGLLVQSEARVVEEIRRIGLRRLPCTRDRVEYADYEEKIRQALARAFRKMPASIFESGVPFDEEQSAKG